MGLQEVFRVIPLLAFETIKSIYLREHSHSLWVFNCEYMTSEFCL